MKVAKLQKTIWCGGKMIGKDIFNELNEMTWRLIYISISWLIIFVLLVLTNIYITLIYLVCVPLYILLTIWYYSKGMAQPGTIYTRSSRYYISSALLSLAWFVILWICARFHITILFEVWLIATPIYIFCASIFFVKEYRMEVISTMSDKELLREMYLQYCRYIRNTGGISLPYLSWLESKLLTSMKR